MVMRVSSFESLRIHHVDRLGTGAACTPTPYTEAQSWGGRSVPSSAAILGPPPELPPDSSARPVYRHDTGCRDRRGTGNDSSWERPGVHELEVDGGFKLIAATSVRIQPPGLVESGRAIGRAGWPGRRAPGGRARPGRGGRKDRHAPDRADPAFPAPVHSRGSARGSDAPTPPPGLRRSAAGAVLGRHPCVRRPWLADLAVAPGARLGLRVRPGRLATPWLISARAPGSCSGTRSSCRSS